MRKKIWELPDHYYCSITGACLSIEQVRIILKQVKYPGWHTESDYKIHSVIIYDLKNKGKASLKVNSLLDKIAAEQIEDLKDIRIGFDLVKKWNSVKNHFDAANYYWAVMSHPLMDEVLMQVVFGDLHMMTHSAMVMLRASRKNEEELIRKNMLLKRKNRDLRSENGKLKKQLDDFRIKFNNRDTVARLVKNNAEKNIVITDCENNSKKEEKNIFAYSEKGKSSEPDRCECFADNNCRYKKKIDEIDENIDLKNKTVLLVGGRKTLKEYCRKIVLGSNGNFQHHDGGLENSRKKLVPTALKADIVICALDCISHTACKSVKRICKKENKNIVYLKNTGINKLSGQIKAVC